MAQAFKCDVCGRLYEGRPHEVRGWGAAPLHPTGKPLYDAVNHEAVAQLCGECIEGAEASLKAFTAERREQTQVTATELVRLANMAGQP